MPPQKVGKSPGNIVGLTAGAHTTDKNATQKLMVITMQQRSKIEWGAQVKIAHLNDLRIMVFILLTLMLIKNHLTAAKNFLFYVHTLVN